MAEGDRERDVHSGGMRVRKPDLTFHNPYPWMGDAEAMVYLELEKRHVPFSWRYFDGTAVNFQQVLKGQYYPEFTLKDYRLVILVIGNYFGTLPGVIDKTSLAQVLLEADGWKVLTLFEDDVRRGVSDLLDKQAPQLIHPAITGSIAANPYGVPNFIKARNKTLVNRRSGHYAQAGSPKEGTRTDEHRLSRARQRRLGESGRLRRGIRRLKAR